ncbi:uncharacterized protein EI90DRAFT_2926637 [Cantharellus anzutake]|uniref:uncharacterized protein n=1 Tax=Cantharellus anzutake TaxID=1750568 RepID=UPI0019036A2C|nr:uncharacterized protein EI90DRAFT_2926637 [Cantharellus anzutake]KAF8328161.1 hypothetical protein EI90DRAFT_2926637 [Cantharellus anzutake]
MGKLVKKGTKGVAKAYVTRGAALKKLQCTLADFRRLCILKGIFPREPRNRKVARRGSTVYTTFYYAKDIAFLAHEPVLKKMREQKIFAKKMARAVGRRDWSLAKSLKENRPFYNLDHIVKERYPTFIDALRDIDDALCLVTLFACLPSIPRISPSAVEQCARLTHEWQLYVMHTRSLRKVFLSIKGVYFQAYVMGEEITWLVPYMFSQTIPDDVDLRVVGTFIDFYRTLLGFVLFKLYTDADLVYPPALDASKNDGAGGLSAFRLIDLGTQATEQSLSDQKTTVLDVEGRQVKPHRVQQAINALAHVPAPTEPPEVATKPQSSNEPSATFNFPTNGSPSVTNLFTGLTFFLARGIPRPLMEFIIRSFGGRVGWTPTAGSGSPLQEDDMSITHVIIDRPLDNTSKVPGELLRCRKYIQPQWVVDSINAQKLLVEGPYEQGQTMPPHLSPFGEADGAYDPHSAESAANEVDDVSDEEAKEPAEMSKSSDDALQQSILTARSEPTEANLRAAEIQAERAGMDATTFEAAINKRPNITQPEKVTDSSAPSDMNKMLMSNKKRKLYENLKRREMKQASQVSLRFSPVRCSSDFVH